MIAVERVLGDPDADGFHILRDVHDAATMAEIRAELGPLLDRAPFGANEFVGSDTTRLGLILTYTESWLRPQDSHLIAVPVEMARGLAPELRALLGYSMRPPFLGYVDGRDPRDLFEPAETR
jgi:hypothetical protein